MNLHDTPTPLRFEQAMAELERILRELEDGTITLEDSLAKYERGVALVRACYSQLQTAEQKIRLLGGLTDDGKPDLKPFEHAATIDRAKPKRTNGKPADDSDRM
jgi:exodeoxyribonuclease VII small subunit